MMRNKMRNKNLVQRNTKKVLGRIGTGTGAGGLGWKSRSILKISLLSVLFLSVLVPILHLGIKNTIRRGNFLSLNSTTLEVVPQRDDLDLRNAPSADRDFPDITVDLLYNLHVPSDWWDGVEINPSYDDLMISLHGRNIWKDKSLQSHIDFLRIVGDTKIFGSPLRKNVEDLLRAHKPNVFLEVGVLRGATSTKIAIFFKQEEGFEHSYIISMDTWLLDLTFAWNGVKSSRSEKVTSGKTEYFKNYRMAGGSQMYYQFMANCMATNTTDRIIPIQTSSLNGAMALLSHGVRPDFMYIDASHANPDVFLDYENFYKILMPGGVMTFDDVKNIPAVKVAFERLAVKYGLETKYLNNNTKNQGYIIKDARE